MRSVIINTVLQWVIREYSKACDFIIYNRTLSAKDLADARLLSVTVQPISITPSKYIFWRIKRETELNIRLRWPI